MPTRRRFLESLFAATATLPALKSDALARIAPAVKRLDGRSAAEVAQDEDFWRDIQAAFDIDRGMINLNNGGVAPSPRVVNAAFQRYLAVSNQAPAITMWGWIEPEIEAVRRRLAANFGCDPEEMAITRNASEALEIVQLGLPLERGDEVLTTTQDYPRMITTWKQRERRDGIVLKQIPFPVPPPSQDDLARRIEAARPHGALKVVRRRLTALAQLSELGTPLDQDRQHLFPRFAWLTGAERFPKLFLLHDRLKVRRHSQPGVIDRATRSPGDVRCECHSNPRNRKP